MPESIGEQVVSGFLVTIGLFLAVVAVFLGGVSIFDGHGVIGVAFLVSPFLGWFFGRSFSPGLARGLLLGGCIMILLMGTCFVVLSKSTVTH